MEVTFLAKEPTTDHEIYGTVCRRYSKDVITVIGITAMKYPWNGGVLAMVHIPAPVDDDDAFPCELLETPCQTIRNEKLAHYLEAHTFSIKSILIYYGMREDETT